MDRELSYISSRSVWGLAVYGLITPAASQIRVWFTSSRRIRVNARHQGAGGRQKVIECGASLAPDRKNSC